MTVPKYISARSVWRTVASLGLCSLATILSVIWLNSREVEVRFVLDATCTKLKLPETRRLPVPTNTAIHVRGFELLITDVRRVQVSAGGQSFATNKVPLKLVINEARASEPPSLQVLVNEQLAQDSYILMPKGTVLSARSVDAGLTIQFPLGSQPSIRVHADFTLPEINRLIPARESSPPEWLSGQETLMATFEQYARRMPAIELTPIEGSPFLEATLIASAPARGPTLPRALLVEESSITGRVEMDGCTAVAVVGDGIGTRKTLPGRGAAILLETSAAEIRRLDFRLHTGILLEISGIAHSLRIEDLSLTRGYLWQTLARMASGDRLSTALGIMALVLLLATAGFVYRVIVIALDTLDPTRRRAKMGNNITVTGSGIVVNIADYMRDVVNVVQQAANSLPNKEVGELLRELVKEMSVIAPKIDAKIAEQMGKDARALGAELHSASPRKKWYELALDGIAEAAGVIGALGAPILKIVNSLRAVLG